MTPYLQILKQASQEKQSQLDLLNEAIEILEDNIQFEEALDKYSNPNTWSTI